jgi:DNA polymerase/3'-5' exonuclease PolX
LLITKEEIAGVPEQIATLLELNSENPFKIRAYTNAARAIEASGGMSPIFRMKNAVTRQTGIWYMNNNVFVSAVSRPTLPADWGLVRQ